MELKRALNLFDIFCIASGAMISSGLFILPGLAFARAGPAVIISYFLAGILSLAGMLSIAEMTTAMPRAGGDCFAIMRSMGPAVGTVAGLLSWFSLAMKSAFALIGMSLFVILLVDIDIHIVAMAFCLFFVAVNYVGIKEAGKTQVALVVGLFALMCLYVVAGFPHVQAQRFVPFAPKGFGAVLSNTGFVFVSYAGLLKIASIAEEIQNPKRNIPLGMIVSLFVVSIFYAAMVFVTAGVLDPDVLSKSVTPISDGASVIMGQFGFVALGIAAILAFLSTANAGIMTAARSLVPLSRDGLLPVFLGSINRRFHTPHYALIVTGIFVIISFFLRLEVLVEAASVVLIMTNILACISVIILRESRLQNYQPSFRVPLYPWVQIIGMVCLGLLIFEMGYEALIISAVLILSGLFMYWFFTRIRANREYALLHVIERITARELTDYSLETELKEIIRERDEIVKDRFDHIIEQAPILDIDRRITVEELFELAVNELSGRLKVERSYLLNKLMLREKESSTALMPGIAIPHVITEGSHAFEILLVRCGPGIVFAPDKKDVHAVFILVGTRDERHFHLQALSAFAQVVQDPDFERKWLGAKSKESLRDLVLLGKRVRH
ncbi:amino acid permease [candidate division WOR-3 bacterium]|nr:amino acid permease [candidate division WOR-3 bacterium]